jgi:predicted DNA-binding transcriptional regulator YafY
MANTSSRMLRLLSLLQTHRHWSGDDLSDRLEVSIRTLRRDIDRLRDLGYPVQASRGVDGGYQLAPGAALPPLVLDDEEAVALAVGLQNAAQGGVSGLAEPSVRALTKVVQVMPPRLRRRVDALRSATVAPDWSGSAPSLDPEVLVAVAQACRDTDRLEFGYTAADGAVTERLVEPLRLVPIERRWYLVGYDLRRHDWRSFRLDRLTGPRRTGVQFRPRELPADDAASFVLARLDRVQSTISVEVMVDADPDQVDRTIGRWASVQAHPGGGCLVRIQADSLFWPAMAMGALDADFSVISPPEFVDYLRHWIDRFGRAVSPAS